MALTLARDDRQAILQVGSYRTDQFQLVDGSGGSAVSTTFAHNTIVRIKAYSGDSWVKIDTVGTAVQYEGLLMGDGEELTMLIYDGQKISCIGGVLNIVPVAK